MQYQNRNNTYITMSVIHVNLNYEETGPTVLFLFGHNSQLSPNSVCPWNKAQPSLYPFCFQNRYYFESIKNKKKTTRTHEIYMNTEPWVPNPNQHIN